MNKVCALLCALLSAACTQEMGKQGHLRVYEPRAMLPLRDPVEHAVARGQAEPGSAEEQKMPKITPRLLARGRERFNIYCTPCHGFTGEGDGIVVQRGFLPPPSYHIERLRKAADQHFFDVITNGFGAMYDYGERIPPSDRWAIVAYIRELQLAKEDRDHGDHAGSK